MRLKWMVVVVVSLMLTLAACNSIAPAPAAQTGTGAQAPKASDRVSGTVSDRSTPPNVGACRRGRPEEAGVIVGGGGGRADPPQC